MKEGKITLTMKQLKRYQVICSYIDKQITRREATDKNKQFQVIDDGFPLIPSKTEIQVLVNPNFGIRVKYRDNIFETIRYVKPAGKMICYFVIKNSAIDSLNKLPISK
ncbi:hypothetical protein [Peptostreptococcus canis]|uniref:Uncharacterized protein n=1 Tax=Peptostreptococcus canis TaxID=1159213 RepID=A0ABR6TJG7_9FIRM|nr:hypothetical protein [Peptostreptococcus canis]MBC2575564.1 hypothetical protein [Peptostreptococcus canis]MBP1997238.1 hypothetical protein [Peptostreptococcus canis]